MKPMFRNGIIALALTPIFSPQQSSAFEGHINATITQGGQSQALIYTVGADFLRVENTATNWPNPVDILDRNSGQLILLLPNNRSFMRLKPDTGNSSRLPPGAPAMPNLPPGVGPQSAPGAPTMPAMPMTPQPVAEPMELQDTGQKTNILGLACEQYEIKQAGETMEIWATEQLIPFQPYVQNQPRRFAPRMIEERWPGLLAARKLFPLLATLRFDNGMERFRFEVRSVTPQKLTDDDATIFQLPPDYHEIQPLPF
jgi:hypothetical protein